jgi:hypothetical protein
LRLDGDSDALAKYGFWNEELAERWANQADVILIEERFLAAGSASDRERSVRRTPADPADNSLPERSFHSHLPAAVIAGDESFLGRHAQPLF